MDAAQEKEVVDRLRRIETRLTRFLEQQGFDTQVQKAFWREGIVEIPSMACAVSECVDVVPPTWPEDDEVIVRHKGRFVMAFYLKEIR